MLWNDISDLPIIDEMNVTKDLDPGVVKEVAIVDMGKPHITDNSKDPETSGVVKILLLQDMFDSLAKSSGLSR